MLLAAQSGIIYDRPPAFSLGVLFELVLMLAASVAVYWTLVRRCTSHRQWISLHEWARERGFKSRPLGAGDLPPPLAMMAPRVRLNLADAKASLLQLEANSGQWNLLIRRTSGEWIPSGLRPAKQDRSLLDEMHLSTYPAYSSTERFT